MKITLSAAILMLSGAMLAGCDSKDNSTTMTPPAAPNTTVTTPATPNTTVTTPTVTTPTMTTPTMPDTSKMSQAVSNGIDTAAAGVKTDAQKMMSAAPTTMPSMPAMPK